MITTIILGCTCMAPIADRVAAQLSVPVVEPMTAGYKFTETLVALRLAQSAAAFPRPASKRLSAIGDLLEGAVPMTAEGDCPVCVVAAE